MKNKTKLFILALCKIVYRQQREIFKFSHSSYRFGRLMTCFKITGSLFKTWYLIPNVEFIVGYHCEKYLCQVSKVLVNYSERLMKLNWTVFPPMIVSSQVKFLRRTMT